VALHWSDWLIENLTNSHFSLSGTIQNVCIIAQNTKVQALISTAQVKMCFFAKMATLNLASSLIIRIILWLLSHSMGMPHTYTCTQLLILFGLQIFFTDIDNDSFLDEIASKIGTKSFRLGILLGLSPAELDALHYDYQGQGLVVMNTAMLIKWRDRGERTSLELAQALWKVGLGRIAESIAPSGERCIVGIYILIIYIPHSICTLVSNQIGRQFLLASLLHC